MPKSKDSSVQVAIIVGVLLAVVGGAWLFLNSGTDEAVAVQQTATKAPISSFPETLSKPDLPLDTALQMAEMAFQSGQLAEPEDGSALYFYRQALRQDPQNSRANSGMSLIETQITDEANEHLGKNDFEKVVNKLAILTGIDSSSENVAAIQNALQVKSDAMFVSMERAIGVNQFDNAERIAESLRVIPHADSGRISALLVSVATGRKRFEAQNAAREEELMAQMQMESVVEFPSTQTTPDRQDAGLQPELETTTANATTEPFETVEAIPEIETTTADATTEPLETVEAIPEIEQIVDVTPLIEKAKARVKQNSLFSPDDDSALYFFEQALQQDPDSSEAKLGLRSLVQNMTSKAFRTAKDDNWTGAEEAMANAKKVGMAEMLVSQTRTELSKLKAQQAANKFVNISEFKVENTVPPKYPRRAIARSVEGWVTVEFTVNETGDTENLKVVDSSKQYRSQFSRSAIAAVKQWRFKPQMIEGQAVAQRSKTTVQFKLAD